jgi:tetratricopeptide (TPR) repeat protein
MIYKIFVLFFFSASIFAAEKQPVAPEHIQEYMGGMEAIRQNDFAKAIDLFVSALQKKPDYPDALAGLGLVYLKISKTFLNRATHYFKKALIINPKHLDALELEGECYLMKGQLNNAYDNYQRLEPICDIEADKLKALLDPILKEAKDVMKKMGSP